MKAIVTGGGGFIGQAIVRQLLAQSHDVVILARNRYPSLEQDGATSIVWDLSQPDLASLTDILAGADTVFHVAALAGFWGTRDAFITGNVTATQHLLNAAQAAAVPQMVFTSSPSVVFDGQHAGGMTEDQVSYPSVYYAHYPETKAIAERMVLNANRVGFVTCALRPHLVWGPGDPHLFPRIIQRAQRRRLIRVGSGTNLVSLTHIDHAADAHIRAAEALRTPSPAPAGKAYFITDGEPVALWPFIDRLLAALALPPIQREVSPVTAYRVGALCETLWKWLPLSGEPPMTRFVAKELASSHWYNINAAKKDFGYQPFRNQDEAFEDVVSHFRNQLATERTQR